MSYTINEFAFESASGLSKIYGKTYIPNSKNIKGVVQIIHGMCEYTERYIQFIEFLLKNNFIVTMHDQLGHGNSISDENLRGYFGDKNGYKYLVEDALVVTQQAKSLYSNLPYFIFGHSMGSFITRLLVAKTKEKIDGIILCGTGGPNPLYKTGVDLANRLIEKKGCTYKSIFLTDIAYKFFNAGIHNSTNPYDWTTRDSKLAKSRMTDTKGNFTFTTAGYRDVFMLVKSSNDKMKFDSTPKDLHIFIISGDKDPVGANSIGVKKVYTNYIASGINDVSLKLYPDARHELLNELNKAEIYKDIKRWLLDTLDSLDFNKDNTKSFELDDKVIKAVMEEIAEYAIEGVNENIGGPFGAAILQIKTKEIKKVYTKDDIKVISIARNTVISSNDPTCHAEVNAIREACKKLKRFDISDCILLTTGKSCPMCIAAAYWAKIPLVYFACDYKEAEEAGFDDREISDYISHISGNYSLKEIKKYESIGKKVFKSWNNKEKRVQY